MSTLLGLTPPVEKCAVVPHCHYRSHNYLRDLHKQGLLVTSRYFHKLENPRVTRRLWSQNPPPSSPNLPGWSVGGSLIMCSHINHCQESGLCCQVGLILPGVVFRLARGGGTRPWPLFQLRSLDSSTLPKFQQSHGWIASLC